MPWNCTGHRRLETVRQLPALWLKVPPSYSLLPWQLGSRIWLSNLLWPWKKPQGSTQTLQSLCTQGTHRKYIHGLANAVSLKSSGLIACGSESTGVYTYYFCNQMSSFKNKPSQTHTHTHTHTHTEALSCFSRVWLFMTPGTVARQTPLSVRFSRQDTIVGCHSLLQGIFPTQGLSPHLLQCRQILYLWAIWEAPASAEKQINILNVILNLECITWL